MMNPSEPVLIQCSSCGQLNRIYERAGAVALCGQCQNELTSVTDNSNLAEEGYAREQESLTAAARAPYQATPRIAIIGTEGSGKTVLITTLAKRFSGTSPTGIFLNPMDNNTIRYVERNWQTLRAGDWPPSSPVGQMFNLHWRLEVDGEAPVECDLRIVDAAGQDLRRLFNEDETISDPNRPRQLQELIAYCQSADIVICLVNLRDFLGEGDPVRKVDNEIVIKSALQRLTVDRSRRVCLLFTQSDQYKETLKKYGAWHRIAEKCIPYVHAAHLAKGQAIVRAVAAVCDTVPADGGNNRLVRVPAPDFGSEGFDGLMGWLVQEVRGVAALQQAASQQPTQFAAPATENTEQQQTEAAITATGSIVAVVLSIVSHSWIPIIVFIVTAIAWFGTKPSAPKQIQVQQKSNGFWSSPSKVSAWIQYGRFYDDVFVRNDSDRMLKELSATLAVWRNQSRIEQHQLQVTDVPPGAVRTWSKVISVHDTDDLTLTVDSYQW